MFAMRRWTDSDGVMQCLREDRLKVTGVRLVWLRPYSAKDYSNAR